MEKTISLAMAGSILACFTASYGGRACASDIRILDRDALINILMACSILGAGGGGSLDEGIKSIDEVLAAGKQFRLADVEALELDTLIGVPYGCGAISPMTEEEEEKYSRLTEAPENMYLLNMKQMEGFLGRNVDAVIPTELDGEPYVTVPDLICVFNLDETMPQLNPYAEVGEHAAVIPLPAPEVWTTPRGLEVFGPRSFGYEIDYRPFC